MSNPGKPNRLDTLEMYKKLISRFPEIQLKGKTMPYTSINGHMFSFLDKEGKLGLRLPENELRDFIKTYNSRQMMQYGKLMKEYVEVPITVLNDSDTISSYFKKSVQHVSTLKPK